MRIVRNVLGAATASAALALVAIPASATVTVPANTLTFSYNFKDIANPVTTVQSSSVTKTVGTTTTSATGSLGVSVSAWNITKNTSGSNMTVVKASQTSWDGGLGVSSANDNLPTVNTGYNGSVVKLGDTCASGACGTHQIDNQGNTFGSFSYDVIQLVFDQKVVLGSIGTTSYGIVSGETWQTKINNKTYTINEYVFDDDLSFGDNNPQTCSKNNVACEKAGLSASTSYTQQSFNGLWDGYRGQNGECTVTSSYTCTGSETAYGRSAASTQQGSYVWYITAGAALANQTGTDGWPADSIIDGFKLASLTAYIYNPSMLFAPEPGTWMMMVLGFGAIGTSIRRRKAEERLATAL